MNKREIKDSIEALSDLIDCGGFRLGSRLDYKEALTNARDMLKLYSTCSQYDYTLTLIKKLDGVQDILEFYCVDNIEKIMEEIRSHLTGEGK